MNEWVTEKPEFKEECLVIAASKFRNEWNYTLFEIKKLDSDNGWYFGLLDSDGDEWGALSDLHAQKYFVMPLLK